MKSNILQLAAILSFTLITSSCEKKGCTHYLATNYDASVSKDDGSCEFKSRAIFYSDDPVNGGNITIKVEGKVVGVLSSYRVDPSNLCFEDSIPFWSGEYGTYNYEATQKNSSEVWKGSFIFSKSNSNCVFVKVNPNRTNDIPFEGALEYNIDASIDSNTITYGNGINLLNNCDVDYEVTLTDSGYFRNLILGVGKQEYISSLANGAYFVKIKYALGGRYSPQLKSNCAVHEETFGPFNLKNNDLLTFKINQ